MNIDFLLNAVSASPKRRILPNGVSPSNGTGTTSTIQHQLESPSDRTALDLNDTSVSRAQYMANAPNKSGSATSTITKSCSIYHILSTDVPPIYTPYTSTPLPLRVLNTPVPDFLPKGANKVAPPPTSATASRGPVPKVEKTRRKGWRPTEVRRVGGWACFIEVIEDDQGDGWVEEDKENPTCTGDTELEVQGLSEDLLERD